MWIRWMNTYLRIYIYIDIYFIAIFRSFTFMQSKRKKQQQWKYS